MPEEIQLENIKVLLGGEIIKELDSFLRNKYKEEDDLKRILNFILVDIDRMVATSEEFFGTVEGTIIFFIFNNNNNDDIQFTGISYVMIREEDTDKIIELVTNIPEDANLFYVRLEELKKILTLH